MDLIDMAEIPEYDYKTFYKDGEIADIRNPYLKEVIIHCEVE